MAHVVDLETGEAVIEAIEEAVIGEEEEDRFEFRELEGLDLEMIQH
jgi:hypothetical protein